MRIAPRTSASTKFVGRFSYIYEEKTEILQEEQTLLQIRHGIKEISDKAKLFLSHTVR